MKLNRTRWVALGAVIALAVGAWGMPVALAAVTSGDKPVFVDVSPQRIADTQFDIGITNPFSSGTPKVLQVTGDVPVAPSGTATVVPDGATGVVLNVTAVNPSRGGFVSVRPGNPGGAPTTSNLNVVTGVTVPNQVTIGLPTGGGSPGRIQIWYQASGGPGSTDVLVDVVGYFDDHRHDDRYYTEAQTRGLIFDQRTLVGTLNGDDGSKLDSGAYTSSQFGTGAYSVTFLTTGLGILPAQMPPIRRPWRTTSAPTVRRPRPAGRRSPRSTARSSTSPSRSRRSMRPGRRRIATRSSTSTSPPRPRSCSPKRMPRHPLIPRASFQPAKRSSAETS